MIIPRSSPWQVSKVITLKPQFGFKFGTQWVTRRAFAKQFVGFEKELRNANRQRFLLFKQIHEALRECIDPPKVFTFSSSASAFTDENLITSSIGQPRIFYGLQCAPVKSISMKKI